MAPQPRRRKSRWGRGPPVIIVKGPAFNCAGPFSFKDPPGLDLGRFYSPGGVSPLRATSVVYTMMWPRQLWSRIMSTTDLLLFIASIIVISAWR